MFKQHPRWQYTWTSPDGNTRNQIDYISIAQRWKTSLMNCRTYPGADCDTDLQLLVATLKVRLAKRQRQHSIPPQNRYLMRLMQQSGKREKQKAKISRTEGRSTEKAQSG